VAYFKHLNRRAGSTLQIKAVQRWPDPQHVVELAARERDSDRKAAKEAGDPSDVFDGVWAVVDIDTHAHLVDAITSAAREGISIAVSGPCFETWLILHEEERTAAFSTPKAAKEHWEQLCRPHRTTDQELTRLDGKLRDAMKRAAQLTLRHEQDDIPRHRRNPSSEIGAMLQVICTEALIDWQKL
jgi:hypothetical protein